MAKRRRTAAARLTQERDLAERMFDELRAAVERRTCEIDEPLRHATQFVRVLEMGRHAPGEDIRSVGVLASEVRSRLERVRDACCALRENAVLDPVQRSRVATVAPADGV